MSVQHRGQHTAENRVASRGRKRELGCNEHERRTKCACHMARRDAEAARRTEEAHHATRRDANASTIATRG